MLGFEPASIELTKYKNSKFSSDLNMSTTMNRSYNS